MKEFWKSADKAVLGGCTAVTFFLLGFLWWIFEPQDSVPMWLFSLAVIVCHSICVVVYAISSRNKKITYVLPKVKTIHCSENKIIFLLEKNELYTQGAYVTIAYQNEDDLIETTLGLGYVETINSLGYMQIVFHKKASSPQADTIISTLSNKKQYRNAIKIKPVVSKNLIEES